MSEGLPLCQPHSASAWCAPYSAPYSASAQLEPNPAPRPSQVHFTKELDLSNASSRAARDTTKIRRMACLLSESLGAQRAGTHLHKVPHSICVVVAVVADDPVPEGLPPAAQQGGGKNLAEVASTATGVQCNGRCATCSKGKTGCGHEPGSSRQYNHRAAACATTGV